MIKVSIVTPCLNSEDTIRDTIESVLRQTYKNIEYIIVDGGSTDGTLNIVREYYPRFNGRMKFVSEKDKGIYDAMNKGIKMTTGIIIGIINSDDYYELDAVESIVRNMKNVRHQVVYGYCNLIKKNRDIGTLKNSHESQGMIPHPACFVTRKIYSDFGMFAKMFKIAGDYEFIMRLYKSNSVTFIQVHHKIANFREGGISSNKKVRNRENAIIEYRYGLLPFREMILKLFGF